MMGFKTVLVHISTIKWGDIVRCPDGKVRTVGKNDIKHDLFMGHVLFGDSYMQGLEPVELQVYGEL